MILIESSYQRKEFPLIKNIYYSLNAGHWPKTKEKSNIAWAFFLLEKHIILNSFASSTFTQPRPARHSLAFNERPARIYPF